MEKLSLEKFKALEVDTLQKICGGDPCGTIWKSSHGTQGTDTYFDDNDNGQLDCGDTVYFDDGTVGTMCGGAMQ